MAWKNIEVWSDYDKAGIWTLHIKKKRGKLKLDEIIQACVEWDQDFYMLVINAMDEEMEQYYMFDDLKGDYVTLYRADDFFKWRDKHEQN